VQLFVFVELLFVVFFELGMGRFGQIKYNLTVLKLHLKLRDFPGLFLDNVLKVLL
jgi:hypothetical protein